MTDHATIWIVATFRTDHLGDFFFHQLGQKDHPFAYPPVPAPHKWQG